MKVDMPNWCSNTTTIQGSYNDLEWMIQCEFDFDVLRPRPPNEDNWYDWNVENWGTKWNRDDFRYVYDRSDETLKLFYRTAWSPPNALLQYISIEKQLKIVNRFIDEAYGFVGQSVFEHGVENTEFIEPSAHSDEYIESYAANHSWFPLDSWQTFIRLMMGVSDENSQ